MAIVNGYTTLADFKTSKRILAGSIDSADDTFIEGLIEAASRWIDDQTGKIFYLVSPAVARYYTAQYEHTVFSDELVTITSVKTDNDGDGTYENTWTASDYWAMPLNGTVKSYLARKPAGAFFFPCNITNGVEITSTFGRSVIPDDIVQACLDYTLGKYLNRFGAQAEAEKQLRESANDRLGLYKAHQ